MLCELRMTVESLRGLGISEARAILVPGPDETRGDSRPACTLPDGCGMISTSPDGSVWPAGRTAIFKG